MFLVSDLHFAGNWAGVFHGTGPGIGKVNERGKGLIIDVTYELLYMYAGYKRRFILLFFFFGTHLYRWINWPKGNELLRRDPGRQRGWYIVVMIRIPSLWWVLVLECQI